MMSMKMTTMSWVTERLPVRHVGSSRWRRPFKTDPADEYVYRVGDRERAGWIPWHSDQTFMPQKNRGGVLRAVTLPSFGGETGFIDTIALYDDLPAWASIGPHK